MYQLDALAIQEFSHFTATCFGTKMPFPWGVHTKLNIS